MNQKELNISREIINHFRSIDREDFLGYLVLRGVQELIKIKLKREDYSANHMDGNADNYMELDEINLGDDDYLVQFAHALLRYGH